MEVRLSDLAAEAESLLDLAEEWHHRAEAVEKELSAKQELVNDLQRQLREREEQIRLLTSEAKGHKEEPKGSWLNRLRRR